MGSLENEIKARAKSLGFPLCGITTPEPPAEYPRYIEWLSNRYHAEMAYLASPYHKSARKDPTQLLPGVKSIITVGLPYRLTTKTEMEQREAGVICGYATGKNYHQEIPRRLVPLVDFLVSTFPDVNRPRIFTDSAPILERELAVRAGLGWIGRNSCLVSPRLGSGMLLAEIFTDIPLLPDFPFTADMCGTCTRCVDACPTRCILPDRTIDANQCISYHSIENHQNIPAKIIEKLTNQVFGCDICQVVCPWNRFSLSKESALQHWNIIPVSEMDQLLCFNQADFNARFGDTPVSRVRLNGFLRNIFIVRGNLLPKPVDDEL